MSEPKNLLYVDMHVHSNFSADAETGISEYIAKAQELGLKGLCFTEHADYNPAEEHYNYFSYEAFSRQLAEMKNIINKNQVDILLLKGIEFSEPHIYSDEFAQLARKEFDVILGAVHWVKGNFVGDKELLKNYSKEEIYADYYDKLLQTVKFAGFDVLAHFDFPRRYLGESYKSKISAIERQILQEVVANNIALEINTSPVRKEGLEPMPARNILAEYYRLGGRRVVLGSDAHALEELGDSLTYAQKIASNTGLQVGYFEQRKFYSYENLLKKRGS